MTGRVTGEWRREGVRPGNCLESGETGLTGMESKKEKGPCGTIGVADLELAKKSHKLMFHDQEHGYVGSWIGVGIPGEEEVASLGKSSELESSFKKNASAK